jgi:tetratricopeptide (TPR) repeat protein
VVAELRGGEAAGALKSGEALYAKKEYELALERIRAAVAADPGNPEALLFEGLTHVRLDDPEKAAAAWEKYQNVTTDTRGAEEIGKMRTILLREAAERSAKDAVKREQQLRGQQTNPRMVAVATFRNAGSIEYASLGKALAAMLIDNLSGLPGVQVVERERVEALEEEARLAGSGLTEKGTAVRAGKLLRAGRVAAGSHADWTASPTHLKLEALLVGVDDGATIAEGKSEAFATEFFKLVPAVAERFAAALGQPVAQLPRPMQEKVQEQHTQNLEAALAFGQALDALDKHDTASALKACKLLASKDPNFKLAKKKCAFVPLNWLTTQAVAATVEPTALAMAGLTAGGGLSYWGPAIGVLVAGGIAGGTYAAVGGGGGGGGGDNGPGVGGNNTPQLNGVGDRTVAAGQTAVINMDCRDPDGTATTIANTQSGPGASFTQHTGTPGTAEYRQATNANQVGQSFAVKFGCTDSGNPPASTSAGATIRVVKQQQPAPEPTPQPTAVPPPTPRQCQPTGDGRNLCDSESECCSGNCSATPFNTDHGACCSPLGSVCNPQNEGGDCCGGPNTVGCNFTTSQCCKAGGQSCTTAAECCSNNCFSNFCF